MKVVSTRARSFLASGLLVLLPCFLANGVAIATGFAHNYGGQVGANVAILATAVDPSGNETVAGRFTGDTWNMGGVTLTRIGTSDAFVAKVDAGGNVLWARNFGGIGATAYGTGVAVDGDGNVFLGGYFQSADLSTPALTKFGNVDAFAIRLDAATGATIWAKNFGGIGATTSGAGVAVDGAGSVYLGGYFRSANLTTPALTRIGSQDAFAFSLDAATGAVTWAKAFGGIGAGAAGTGVATDGAGNVYLSGFFDSANLTTPALTIIGFSDAFAFKLDTATGATTWAKNFGGIGAVAGGEGVAADGAGNVYLGGTFKSASLTTPALTKIGNVDAFALKLDSSTGATAWAKNFGGIGADASGKGLAVDGAGDVYLGGYFQLANLTTPALTKIGTIDAFAFKLDATTGATTWAKNFGGIGATATGSGVATDGADNVFLVGNFGGNLTTPVLTVIGGNDGFVFRLDSSTGATNRANGFGGGLIAGGTAAILGTAVDASGNEFIAGNFNGLTLNLGGVTLTRIGTTDAFVGKLDAGGNVLWARNLGGIGAIASGTGVAADGAGNVYLGGSFQSADLTTPALTKLGISDAFAIKLDGATGATTWAKNLGGIGASTSGTGVAVDGAGNVYLGGNFQSANLTTPALTKLGISDAFAIKLDGATGATTWAKNFGGIGAGAAGTGVATDGTGIVYLGGSFDGANLTTPALTKIGIQDAFAIKLDATTGATTWAKNFGGIGAQAYGTGVAVDGAGSVYLGGYFRSANLTTPALTRIGNQDAFAFKLDGTTGVTNWARNFGGINSQAYGTALAADGAGNVYLGGYFRSANLTTPALTKIGLQDAFAFKIDATTGIVSRFENFGGISNAQAYGTTLAADGAGNLYLGGSFNVANLTTPALTKIGATDALFLTPTHGVVYDGNGHTGGNPPTDVKGYWSGDSANVLGAGTLVRTGYSFNGWNTASNGSGTSYGTGATLTMAAVNVTLFAQWAVVASAPTMTSGRSRKVHGTGGTFDLALGSIPNNPTIEPRAGPTQTIVMSFDKPIASAAIPTITEGAAVFSTMSISGNDVILNFTGVTNLQYVTFSLANVASSDGGTGGIGSIRVGFLFGDVNQSQQVTVADVGIVNSSLLQTVTNANFLRDVNADGKLTVADKGLTNANLLKKLPAP